MAEREADLLTAGKGKLNWTERFTIRFVRGTFTRGALDRVIRTLQRVIGSTWIHHFTKNLRHVYGLERLPQLTGEQSLILVCNHRSFFDLYVVIGHLVRRGLPQRIIFPVRAKFFYTSLLGLFVNGVMSFFAMYPPLFRERRQATLNVVSLAELAAMLERGGLLVGFHPEGTRKQDDDPYTLLPAQRGVGRIIQDAGRSVPVVPVFINGLLPKNLRRQIASNFDGTGRKIVVVFGEPIDFGSLLDQPSTPKTHQAIADQALAAVAALGDEERRYRAELELN